MKDLPALFVLDEADHTWTGFKSEEEMEKWLLDRHLRGNDLSKMLIVDPKKINRVEVDLFFPEAKET